MNKKYKILFISPFNDKTWQSEFNRPTLLAGLSLITFSFIASLSLILLSVPIVKEYFEITAINKEIKQQKEKTQKMQRDFIMNLIKQEQEKGMFENMPTINPVDGPQIDTTIEGPSI